MVVILLQPSNHLASPLLYVQNKIKLILLILYLNNLFGQQAGKLRHDENVLGGGGAACARRGIRVPDELRGPLDYVTDDAVVVPAVTPALRRQLWEGLERYVSTPPDLHHHLAVHCPS